MDILITEKQLKKIIKKKEVSEDNTGPNPEPQAGTSSQQSGGQGYPEVSKWESGVTRGPANQVGVTKWSDVVGSSLKRDKGNQLKENKLDEQPIGFPGTVYRSDASQVRGGKKEYTSGGVKKDLKQIPTAYVESIKSIWNWITNNKLLVTQIVASLVVGFFTGGATLWVQALWQLGVQLPFSVYDYYKGDNFGASLGLILAIIPLGGRTLGVGIKRNLAAMKNGGADFLKELSTKKTPQEVIEWYNKLPNDSQEKILLSRLMKQTPAELEKTVGEGAINALRESIKNGSIDLMKIPDMQLKWWKDLVFTGTLTGTTVYVGFKYNTPKEKAMDAESITKTLIPDYEIVIPTKK